MKETDVRVRARTLCASALWLERRSGETPQRARVCVCADRQSEKKRKEEKWWRLTVVTDSGSRQAAVQPFMVAELAV